MSNLSPELKELVRAGKRAALPTEADSARILDGLRARLGDAAIFGDGTAFALGTPTSPRFLTRKAFISGIAGVTLLGGLLFFTAHNHRAASRESNAAARAAATIPAKPADPPRVVSAVPTSPQAEAVGAVPAGSLGAAGPTETHSRASYHAGDNLAAEVTLLSRAETALHSGRPAVALKLLDEHARKFRNGQLAEERVAARVQALCALGRTTEADAQLARLSPMSLHGEPARQACTAHKPQ